METTGDDKRIQALFSELRSADEQLASSFAAAWRRAQPRSVHPRRAFTLAFAAAMALLVFGSAVVAIRTMYSQRGSSYTAFATVPATGFTKHEIETPSPAATDKGQNQLSPRPRRAGTHRQLLVAQHRRTEQAAKQIAAWQSPTASLLSSSNGDLFKSLPQLNENASELKSFLPNRLNDKEY